MPQLGRTQMCAYVSSYANISHFDFFFAYILFLIIAFWCLIGSYQYTILSTVRVNLVFCPCRIAAVTLPLAGCIEKIYGVTTETETSCQEAVTCKTDFVF